MHIILGIAGLVVKELFRRKDFYVLFFLTALLTLLLGSIHFFEDISVVRYLKEISLLLIWLSTLVIAITTTARQIPAERESKTIYPLLAKPVSRPHLLIGKFLGSWMAASAALLVFYLFFFFLVGIREQSWPVWLVTQAVVFHMVFLGIVTALVLLGSLLFSSVAANATICFAVVFGLWFLAQHLMKLARGMAEPGQSIVAALYYLLPHLEFYDWRQLLIHDHPAVAMGPWLIGALYGIVYTALLLTAAIWTFQRKPLD